MKIVKHKLLSILVTAAAFLCLAMPFGVVNAAPDTSVKNQQAETPLIKEKTDKQKKNEAGNVFSKFLISMLWVGGSCAVIYLLLLAYKRLKGAKFVNNKTIDIDKNLNSPDTVEEATRLFIEKF